MCGAFSSQFFCCEVTYPSVCLSDCSLRWQPTFPQRCRRSMLRMLAWKGCKRGWRQLAAPRASLAIPYRTCAKPTTLTTARSRSRWQLAYGNPAPPPTALAELERVSPPEEDPWCLRWGSQQSVLVGGRRLLAAQEKANTWPSLTSLMCRNLIVETGKFRSLEFIVLLRSSFFLAHAFA